ALLQLMAVGLLAVVVYRFSRLWVSARAASYAAAFSVFLGAVAFLVYSAGQLSTMLSAPIYLLALPYFYEWSRSADAKGLLKGLVLVWAAASVHHVTLIFGSVLFAVLVLWLACIDCREGRSVGAVLTSALMLAVAAGIGVGVILLPSWIASMRQPFELV